MKKFFIVLATLLVVLTGCKKEEIKYDYDYTNYLDINFLGSNGYGILQVSEKDISLNDFKTEADYIEFKKLLPSILSNIYISQQTGLKNGDVVELGVNETFAYTGNLSIDFGKKSITVSGLPEPRSLDLFSSDVTVFYGLDGTTEVYYYFPETSPLNEEAKEHLSFSITLDDAKVQKDKTILTIATSVDEYITEQNSLFTSASNYLVTKGFLPRTEGESTLKKVVKDSDFTSMNPSEVKKQLESKMDFEIGDEYLLDQILTVQKYGDYQYYVVANFLKGESEIAQRYRIKVASVDGRIEIISCSKDGSAKKDDMYKNTELTFDFRPVEVEAVEEIETTEETIEETTNQATEE